MSLRPRLCGVILAAGDSTRMGTDKALLAWPPATAGTASAQTFLSAAIEAFEPFTDMIIVVAGKNEATLAPVVFAHGASLVRNPDPERGQFSSLQVGLQEVLNHGRDTAMVTLVDRPAPKSSTLEVLCDEFQRLASGTWAVVPEFDGKHGHPILLTREMIEIFLKAAPTAIARDVEHEHQKHITYVAVDDPSITRNVNTPQDYAALASSTSNQA